MSENPNSTEPRTLPVDAVLFDMDGTLSDTEALWQEAEKQIVVEYGTRPPGEWTAQQIGASLDASAAYLQEHYGVRLDATEIQRLTIEHVLALLEEGFEWRPGARELLAEAKAMGIPSALVTTSPRSVAEAVARPLPAGSFDVIVAAEDVAQTKPDPAPYLAAARQLGARPEYCIAFEDSVNGTLSAQRAGCLVVVVPTHVEVEEAERRLILESLAGVSLSDLARYL